MLVFVNCKVCEISCLCGLLFIWFGLLLKLFIIVYEFLIGEKKYVCILFEF